MKIGIISDTHNEIKMVEKALEIFRERHVDQIVHAGDITSSKILELFNGIPSKFVLGNCDIDVEALNQKSMDLGFGPVEHSCEIIIGDKKILVFHGNDIPLFREAVRSGKYNYIIKGHTHYFENYASNKTRVINPGSIYRGDERTIAILNIERDKVEKITIEPD